jgi:sulfatase modifying factor 1
MYKALICVVIVMFLMAVGIVRAQKAILRPTINKSTIKSIFLKKDGEPSKLEDIKWNLGVFTEKGQNESIVSFYDGDQCHAEGWSEIWLLRFNNGRWKAIKNLADSDNVSFKTINIDGDSINEVWIEASSGGQGYFGTFGRLVSLVGNKEIILYGNEGEDNQGAGQDSLLHEVDFKDIDNDKILELLDTTTNYDKDRNPVKKELHTYKLINGKYEILETFKNQINLKTETIISKDGAVIVLIPAGEFQMGSNEEKRGKPIHTVYLDDFYMDKYEVTNIQYRKFMQATGRKEPEGSGPVDGQEEFKPLSDKNFNGDNQPVVCVSWEDAKAYAEWAGKRLPTEAEWEKAARGGLVNKKYVWGDDSFPPRKAGNFGDETTMKIFPQYTDLCIKGYIDDYAYTAPVGSFNPNGYGLFDMAGNVAEWCSDWFSEDYYTESSKQNPIGPDTGEYRVVRGDSWGGNIESLRIARRNGAEPKISMVFLGFRCVVDSKK